MKKIIEISLISILLASLFFSLIFTLLTEYVVGLKFFIGFGGALLIGLTRLRFVKISNILLGLILFAGTFNLVEFSHISYSFTIILIGFNPFVLILLVIFLALNWDEINNLIGGDELSVHEKQVILDKEVESYKNQFVNKSILDLEEIINNPESYTEAAVIASSQLIEEKKNVAQQKI